MELQRSSLILSAATVRPASLRPCVQTLQIDFILFPGEIAGVSVPDHGAPLLPGQPFYGVAPFHLRPGLTPTKHESADIARIVQDPQGLAVAQFSPHQLPLVRSRVR
jgi:hypothetical protein